MDTPSSDGPFAELNNMHTKNLTQLSDVRTANNSLGFGRGALTPSTATNVIAMGEGVGASSNTATKSISLGSAFGAPYTNTTSQNGIGSGSIAIGTSANGDANPSHLGNLSVMIGGAAAYEGCGDGCVVVGQAAGSTNPPNDHAVLLGTQAGNGSSSSAGANSICIGLQAGESGSGQNSILIGHAASGVTNSSIVLNATGSTLSSVASGLVVKPIVTLTNTTGSMKPPSDSNFSHYLAYNPGSGEVRAVPHA